jgi:hypothetical protein
VTTTETPRWFKSSYSGSGGACVEIATNLTTTHGIIPVRDSKNPNGPRLGFETAAWSSFVTAIRDSDFPA